MAYTIPEYVDTQEQAILAVASAVKGEEVAGGDGSVNGALDILADALAGEDVEVPMTNQGAILALAQYVSGGGGGVDLGPLGLVFAETANVPTVNEGAVLDTLIDTGKIDEVEVFGGDPATSVSRAAAGLTLTTFDILAENADTMDAYVCTLDADYKYATVEPWDGTITRRDATHYGDPAYQWEFVMPELQEGEYLVMWAYLAS